MKQLLVLGDNKMISYTELRKYCYQVLFEIIYSHYWQLQD